MCTSLRPQSALLRHGSASYCNFWAGESDLRRLDNLSICYVFLSLFYCCERNHFFIGFNIDYDILGISSLLYSQVKNI